MSKSRKKQKRKALTDKELRRYVIFLTIPCLMLLLLIVALIFGEGKGSDTGENTSSEVVEEATDATLMDVTLVEPDTKEYIQDFGGSLLDQDKVPEINYLMEKYFYSMTNSDMGIFMDLFTSQDTSQAEVFKERFDRQREYIEGYQNISCYTTKGMEDNSYVAYVYYDKKFVGVETLCPAMFRVYVKLCDDGQYRIYDEKESPELTEYLNHISKNEDVRLLSNMVDRKLLEAEEEDPELEKRIAFLKKGPDYMQEESGADTQAPSEQADEPAHN